MPSTSWTLPPPSPRPFPLGREEVHVWQAALDLPEAGVWELRRLLSEDEQRRAEGFYFPRDRARYVVGRGLLRTLLGGYLDRDPVGLRFSYSAYGKPRLAGPAGEPALHFNLAHSGGLALYALARGRELGIDVEQVRPDFAGEEIAARFFSPREVAALRAVPAGLRREAFFHCWARKEAYLKATGKGLSLALDGFDVALAPGEPAALLAVRDNPAEAGRWSLRALEPAPGYVAALAVEGHSWRLHCGCWPAPAGPARL